MLPTLLFFQKSFLLSVQMKRSIAQNLGTTYVYDYLDLFNQAVLRRWKRRAKSLGEEEKVPEKLVGASGSLMIFCHCLRDLITGYITNRSLPLTFSITVKAHSFNCCNHILHTDTKETD
jgi:hypothetical protein